MLRIGKANEYFTLWSVSNETRYTSQKQPYEVTHFLFMGNLSKDLNKAQEKAKNKGCKDLTPDESLRGQTRWERSGNTWEPEQIPAGSFQFGKYEGKDITEMMNEDIKKNPDEWSDFQSYLSWYFGKLSHIEHEELVNLIPNLLTFIQWTTHKRKDWDCEVFIPQKDKGYYSVMDKIDSGKCGVLTVSNFKLMEGDFFIITVEPHGFVTDEESKSFFQRFSYGIKVRVHLPNCPMKRKEYKGNCYWVPEGMRTFKNTIMNLKKKTDEHGDFYTITHIVTTGETGYKKNLNPLLFTSPKIEKP